MTFFCSIEPVVSALSYLLTCGYRSHRMLHRCVDLRGPPGDTGATGATGPKGFSGATGNTGRVGSTGATGETGPPGLAVSGQGPTGQLGPAGDTGHTGYTGRRGSIGFTGRSHVVHHMRIYTVSQKNFTIMKRDEGDVVLGCASQYMCLF